MDDPFHLWNQGEGGQIYTPVIRENHGWEEQTVLVSFADVGSRNTGKHKYMHGAHTQFPFVMKMVVIMTVMVTIMTFLRMMVCTKGP